MRNARTKYLLPLLLFASLAHCQNSAQKTLSLDVLTSSGGVAVMWDWPGWVKGSGVTFTVMRALSPDPQGPYTILATGVDALNYVDYTGIPGQAYWYGVMAFGPSGPAGQLDYQHPAPYGIIVPFKLLTAN